MNNNSVLTMLDSFIESTRLEKRASEPTTALYAANPAKAGLAPVVEGERAKENTADAANNYAVSDSVGDPQPNSDVITDGTVNTSDASEPTAQISPKAQPADDDVFSKTSALRSLGNNILAGLSKKAMEDVTPGEAKQEIEDAGEDIKDAGEDIEEAAEDVAPMTPHAKVEAVSKTAASDADLFSDFIVGYASGISKKSNDDMAEEEMMAQADDGMGGEEGANDAAALDALMQAGVSAEDLTGGSGEELTPEEIQTVEMLLAEGMTVDELVTILAQAEGGAPDEVAAEEPAMDEMTELDPELIANEMPQEAVDVAVEGAEKIASAAKVLGVKPYDLFTSLFNARS